MRELLIERKFPVDEVRYFASARSAGSRLPFGDTEITVEDSATADFAGLELALFSNGKTASREFAPKVAATGAVVVDNSSGWRMDPDVPLVVSEVNPGDLDHLPKGIVANPNCTTMAAMPVLAPLHREATLTRLVVSTYQAVSGSGGVGVSELEDQARALVEPGGKLARGTEGITLPEPKVYAGPIARSTYSRWPARSLPTAPVRPTRSRSSGTRAARSCTSRTSRSPAPASACPSSPATR